MRRVAHHVKCQAQIRRPDFITLAVDDVSDAEKSGRRILPISDEAFKRRYKARPAQITDLPAPEHEARDHGYREIELFPIVSPTAHHVRPTQILKISNHAPRIVDPIEKSRLQAPRPLSGQELVR